jgi:hypothetical protein
MKILLLDDAYDLTKLTPQGLGDYAAIICLFWLAPSTKDILKKSRDIPAFSLQELISSEMAWGRQAYELARQVFDRGPRYAGLALRSYLAEPLTRESYFPFLITKVLEFCERLRITQGTDIIDLVGFLKESHIPPFSRQLSSNPRIRFKAGSLDQEPDPGSKSNLISRLLPRLREGLATGNWHSQMTDLLEWLDKTCHYRCLLGSKLKKSTLSKGEITFFSSYQNNSRILSFFGDLMPLSVTWLLANYSALRGITAAPNNIFWAWQFFKKSSPQPREAEAFDLGLEKSSSATHYLYNTDSWKDWLRVENRLLLNLTRSWESYLDEAKPRLIVMASQWGIEGWFTHLARCRGIPVLQIMHGILGGYFHTQTPIISDAMIVPGEFWKNLWPEDQQSKIFAFNPPGHFPPIARPFNDSPRTITFFSWPLAMVPYYNFYEITDGFIRIFHNLLIRKDISLIVRAHPLENPADFIERWNILYGPLPARINIVKDEPLEVTLAKTDLAVMYCSTVMLNCLANGIPLVIPGWIDYGWNEELRKLSSCYLANDFRDLEERLRLWLDCLPHAPEASASAFVRPAGVGQDEFTGLLKDLLFREPLEGAQNPR